MSNTEQDQQSETGHRHDDADDDLMTGADALEILAQLLGLESVYGRRSPPPSYEELRKQAEDETVLGLLRRLSTSVSAEVWVMVRSLTTAVALAAPSAKITPSLTMEQVDELVRIDEVMQTLYAAYLLAKGAVDSGTAHWDREIYRHIEDLAELADRLGNTHYQMIASSMRDGVARYV